MNHRPKAFTLVELLVVVAIIALLVSILLPALGQARESAKKVVCGTQIHQIGLGINVYTEDNDDMLPMYMEKDKPTLATLYHNNRVNIVGDHNGDYQPIPGNERKLTPYIDTKVCYCPMDKGYRKGSGVPSEYDNRPFYDIYGSSYVYNAVYLDPIEGLATSSKGEAWGGAGHRIVETLYNQKSASIRQAGNMVMLGDRTIAYSEYFTTGTQYLAYTQMHDEKSYETNILFVDGHVAELELKEAPDHLKNSDYRFTLK